MLRTGFALPTLVYVGWFGPRGLASIVFAGVVVSEAVPEASAMTDVVLLTVAVSLVAHGVTAAWGARRYAAWFERAATVDAEIPEAAELPGRRPVPPGWLAARAARGLGPRHDGRMRGGRARRAREGVGVSEPRPGAEPAPPADPAPLAVRRRTPTPCCWRIWHRSPACPTG